jgi:MFS superfamily sulfate permease-like transporter
MKLFAAVGSFPRRDAWREALAGLSLASMSIPQVLGYTRIAGTPVVAGLYTLLVPLVAFAAFGSSRHLVVAADSATAAILAAGLGPLAPAGSPHYMDLVAAVALLTAAMLLIARIFRLGFLADFLSRTVLVGFLAGVGIQVGVAVTGEMLGVPATTHRTVQQIAELAANAGNVHGPTFALAAVVVAVILAGRRFAPHLPVPLIAIVAAIGASVAFDFAGRGIAVIGPVPGGLPPVALPDVGWVEALAALPIAASCFVVIVAQSAATARALAVRYNERVDENADLLGLAAANAGAAVTGAFVVNGSPTQTEMADRVGARTQLAQLVAAATVLLVLLLLTGPLAHLPRAVLAGIVFTIAVGLFDPRALFAIRRESPGEFALAVITAAAVALIGVQQGILLAVALSLLRHVRHTYRPHTSVLVHDPDGGMKPVAATQRVQTEPGIIVYHFGADLFYANESRFVDEVEALVHTAPTPVRAVVVDAGAITNIDYSAARAVRDLAAGLRTAGVALLFGRVSASLRADMERHGIVAAVGASAVCTTLHQAVERARPARRASGGHR